MFIDASVLTKYVTTKGQIANNLEQTVFNGTKYLPKEYMEFIHFSKTQLDLRKYKLNQKAK